jgi:hypothetical protein
VIALRRQDLWLVVALAAPFVVTAGATTFTTDTWWSLKMGQMSVMAGRPLIDVVLASAPVSPGATNAQWLAQASLYVLYTSLGEYGVRLAAGLLLATAFGLVLAAAHLAGGSLRTAALAVVFATLLSASNLAVRSQLLAFPLFALTSLLLHLRRRRARLLWILPAVFTLWANLHGSFVLGLLLVALYLAGDALEAARGRELGGARGRYAVGHLALVLVASCAATWINPLGPGIYAYIMTIMASPAVRDLVEWQPTTIQDPTGLLVAISGLLLFTAMRASRHSLDPIEVLLLLVFGYLALASLRYVVWWGLVLAPILARHAAAGPAAWLDRWVSRPSDASGGPAPLNLAIAALLAVLAFLSPLWRPALADQVRGSKAASSYAPVEAADFLATLPAGGRVYSFQPWTGYLAWRLWPAQQPMIDLRAEAHPPSVWRDYFAVNVGVAEWEAILARYEVDYLVLQPAAQSHLAELAQASHRWTRLYDDELAVVLAKRPGP